MENTKTTIKTQIAIQNDEIKSDLNKYLYEDTLLETSHTPDLILKTGPEKSEFYCHKLMLIAASDFLHKIILTATPGTVPVILLPDIKTNLMQYLIVYIYHGEVTVPFEKYADFVEASKLLELKGPINEMVPLNLEPNIEIETDDRFEENESLEDPIKFQSKIQRRRENPLELQEDMIKFEEIPAETSNSNESLDITSTQPNASKGRNTPDYLKYAPRDPKNPIGITTVSSTIYRRRLLQCIRHVYSRNHIQITPKIEHCIQSSYLYTENKRLIRGVTTCGLCDKKIEVTYFPRKGTISWCNYGLRKHFNRSHSNGK